MIPARLRFPALAFRLALAAMVLLPAVPALAGNPDGAVRGVVDGSFLERFAPRDDDGTFVEVSLTKPLLELAAQVLEAQDPRVAEMVRQLDSVSARVIELPDGDETLDEATRAFREVAGRLHENGWQVLAKVRDGGDEIHVLALPGGDTVDGLTVMVRSSDGELVFANIAGKIDLSRLAEVLGALNVPGIGETLSAVPGAMGMRGDGKGTRAGKKREAPTGKDASPNENGAGNR